jgi:hypothetical protein
MLRSAPVRVGRAYGPFSRGPQAARPLAGRVGCSPVRPVSVDRVPGPWRPSAGLVGLRIGGRFFSSRLSFWRALAVRPSARVSCLGRLVAMFGADRT